MRTPVTPSPRRKSRWASPRATKAKVLSAVYSPIEKMPATVKRLERGIAPSGVLENSLSVALTRSPTWTPSIIASWSPSRMLNSPSRRSSIRPSRMRFASSETARSEAGSMPMTSAAWVRPPLSRPSRRT